MTTTRTYKYNLHNVNQVQGNSTRAKLFSLIFHVCKGAHFFVRNYLVLECTTAVRTYARRWRQTNPLDIILYIYQVQKGGNKKMGEKQHTSNRDKHICSYGSTACLILYEDPLDDVGEETGPDRHGAIERGLMGFRFVPQSSPRRGEHSYVWSRRSQHSKQYSSVSRRLTTLL